MVQDSKIIIGNIDPGYPKGVFSTLGKYSYGIASFFVLNVILFGFTFNLFDCQLPLFSQKNINEIIICSCICSINFILLGLLFHYIQTMVGYGIFKNIHAKAEAYWFIQKKNVEIILPIDNQYSKFEILNTVNARNLIRISKVLFVICIDSFIFAYFLFLLSIYCLITLISLISIIDIFEPQQTCGCG